MGTTEERREHFAKKRLTFLLATFIIGVLCSTHPDKYFKPAEYHDNREPPAREHKDRRTKRAKKKDRSAETEEREEWRPPSKDSRVSSSSAFSKSSGGSSFARFIGRRKNDAHTFRQNRKAAKSLALACPVTPDSERTLKAIKPVIVEDTRSEPLLHRQSSANSPSNDPFLRGPLSRVPTGLPPLSARSSRTAIYSPPTPAERNIQFDDHVSIDTPKRRPTYRRGHSSKSLLHEQPLTPSQQQQHLPAPFSHQSPVPSPRSDFCARNIERSTIEEDNPLHSSARLGSPSDNPLAFINSSPGIAKPATSTRRTSFLSGLWKRRADSGTGHAPTLAIQSPPIILSGHFTGTPASTTSTSRPNYFGKRRFRSEDSISDISPRTNMQRRSRGRSSKIAQSPRIYIDVTEWLERSGTPLNPAYLASDGQQYPRLQLTSPGAPSFLPSEMRRINTPPLQQIASAGGPRGIGKGFLLDYRRALALASSEESLHSRGTRSRRWKTTSAEEDSNREGDFFRMRIDQQSSSPTEETRKFAFGIPDHLPSSPLCPLHPKHHGGSKLICPMHGRAKNKQG
ncbi:hypothetical protein CAC42_6407 [Sphaceloma murrayae]|uniref:Uncharacterized protein n=1 Tax=Sphaceloma murrayae TaxID=2082308 RepID=A0A2K1QN72_9PEZI|nr:hypothetical protein CAC42_6407 [Sphaceloma murrayae]